MEKEMFLLLGEIVIVIILVFWILGGFFCNILFFKIIWVGGIFMWYIRSMK